MRRVPERCRRNSDSAAEWKHVIPTNHVERSFEALVLKQRGQQRAVRQLQGRWPLDGVVLQKRSDDYGSSFRHGSRPLAGRPTLLLARP